MSALDRFSDSSRTSPEVRIVPITDIARLFGHLVDVAGNARGSAKSRMPHSQNDARIACHMRVVLHLCGLIWEGLRAWRLKRTQVFSARAHAEF